MHRGTTSSIDNGEILAAHRPRTEVLESTVTIKTASITLAGGDLRFVARSGSGHTIVLDDGHGDTGMRPSELIPIAVAGCTAMDVISILRKKRQAVSRYEVRASGEQQEAHPNAFSRIDIVHVFEGEAINVEAVRRAIELSATKYCAVGATLSSGMTEIHHAYLVRDRDDEERMSEVIVTGPLEAADAPGTRLAGAAALAA
jgi:putative redox protein